MTQPLRAPEVQGGRVRSAARSLRSPSSGVLGQGVRFILAGGTVVVVYVTTTTVLSHVVGLNFQLSLAIGFAVALVVQFMLYRLFVWSHDEDFALSVHHQAGRYLAIAAANYGLTVVSTSLLPSALGISTEIVYLVTVATLPAINFVVFRYVIFHAEPAEEVSAGPAITSEELPVPLRNAD
jgi:putative flippase GtrA